MLLDIGMIVDSQAKIQTFIPKLWANVIMADLMKPLYFDAARSKNRKKQKKHEKRIRRAYKLRQVAKVEVEISVRM